MITLMILLIVTFIAVVLGLTMMVSLGGIGVLVGGDIIVAVAIIWFLFFRKHQKKDE